MLFRYSITLHYVTLHFEKFGPYQKRLMNRYIVQNLIYPSCTHFPLAEII